MVASDKQSLLDQITSLKQENERLKEQLASKSGLLESFLDCSPATAFFKDADGHLLYVNKILRDSFGFLDNTWYGKNEFDLFPEEVAIALRENDRRILASGEAEDLQEDVGFKGGDGVWMTNKFRFSDSEGNFYIGGMGVDLTRQTQVAKSILDVIENVKAISAEKTEFLSLMSHELRTPLHSILSSAEQWDDAEDEEAKKELVSYISFGAARLRSQVDNLVLLAETDGGELTAGEFEFEVRPLVNRIASCIQGLITDTVSFSLDYDASIPAYCIGDPYLIEHMIRTVLENACKYTEHGELKFYIFWDSEREHINFRIEDSGCGMTEKQQGRIYSDVIELSRGLNRDAAGMGLGLTICCRLSALLNADLVMESLVGVGTKVELSVPVRPLIANIAVADANCMATGAILIVEDNPVNAKVLSRMISKMGYRVDCVDSGDAALKRLTEQVYGLIFMDIQMPVMDGITATRWIRRRGINTPIVAISCNSEFEVRRSCMQHGINDFLVKPARRSDVFRVLERQISSH